MKAIAMLSGGLDSILAARFIDDLAVKAAGIILRYCDTGKDAPVELDLIRQGHPRSGVTSLALSETEIERMRI